MRGKAETTVLSFRPPKSSPRDRAMSAFYPFILQYRIQNCTESHY